MRPGSAASHMGKSSVPSQSVILRNRWLKGRRPRCPGQCRRGILPGAEFGSPAVERDGLAIGEKAGEAPMPMLMGLQRRR